MPSFNPKDQSNTIKIYPHMVKIITYPKQNKNPNPTHIPKKTKPTEALERSLRRSKSQLRDYIQCNTFDAFITLTIASDRQNIERSKQKVHKWLRNHKDQNPSFSYICVPEFHKDKKSLHFHILSNNYKGTLTKGIKRNNKILYNIKSYRSGYSTYLKLTQHENTYKYLTKYITKDMPFLAGKKRYWASRNLQRPLTFTDNAIFLTHDDVMFDLYKNDFLTSMYIPITLY